MLLFVVYNPRLPLNTVLLFVVVAVVRDVLLLLLLLLLLLVLLLFLLLLLLLLLLLCVFVVCSCVCCVCVRFLLFKCRSEFVSHPKLVFVCR